MTNEEAIKYLQQIYPQGGAGAGLRGAAQGGGEGGTRHPPPAAVES
jgi:hypothetical protein